MAEDPVPAPGRPAEGREASVHDRYYLDLWERSGFALNPPEKRRWQWMLGAIARYLATRNETSDRVLDYGCGSGRFLPLLQDLGRGPVVGFDVTRSVLEEVAARHLDAEIVAGSGAFPTPLPDAAFDLTMSSEVIEHVEEQTAFAADLARVTKPGGLLLLTTPNARFEVRYKAGTRGLQPIENWLDKRTLERLLDDAGFEILESSTTGAHWANMPYQRIALYRLIKRSLRRLRAWSPVDTIEHQLAGRLGRGITLLIAARRRT